MLRIRRTAPGSVPYAAQENRRQLLASTGGNRYRELTHIAPPDELASHPPHLRPTLRSPTICPVRTVVTNRDRGEQHCYGTQEEDRCGATGRVGRHLRRC